MQPGNILQFDPVEIKAGSTRSTSSGTTHSTSSGTAGLPTDNPPAKIDMEKLMLGLVPFTPVQFTGPDALLAWGRLAGYGLLAYVTYNKIRPVAYLALGAAGVSLATSLSAKMWGKK